MVSMAVLALVEMSSADRPKAAAVADEKLRLRLSPAAMPTCTDTDVVVPSIKDEPLSVV